MGTVGVPQRGDKEILDQDHKGHTQQLKLRVLKEMLIDKGCTNSEISELLDEARKLLELKDNALVTTEKFSEMQRKDSSRKKEVVRHDSSSSDLESHSDSESESDSDSGSECDYDKKHVKPRRRYDSTDDNSSDESLKSRKKKIKKTSKRKRYDSDEDHRRKSKFLKSKQKYRYDKCSSDDSARDRQNGKINRKSRKFDSDSEYNSDENTKTHRSRKPLKSRLHDSNDELHADRYEKYERSQFKRRTNETHGPDDFPRDNRRKTRSGIQGKDSGRYGEEGESDFDEATIKKRQQDDTDDDELNTDHVRQERKNRRNRKDRRKRKLDDGRWDERSEEKSRKRDSTKETVNGSAIFSSERARKSYKNKEDYSKDNKEMIGIMKIMEGVEESEGMRKTVGVGEEKHEGERRSIKEE